MDFRKRFAARLALRVALLLAALAVASLLAGHGGAPTAMMLALGAVLLLTIDLWRLMSRSNIEMARFVSALERTDLSQSFSWQGRGTGFDRLGEAYESALARLRRERAGGVGAATFAAALADGAPTPLLVLGPGDALTLGNKAARRQFGRGAPVDLDGIQQFGQAFVDMLRLAAPGPSRLGHIVIDGLSQRVVIDTTAIEVAGTVRRIVAVKTIQAELDGAELAAQIDLVRVLTHEIMNSLTPVTSLAGTAKRLLDALEDTAHPNIGDARLAVNALARRAGELEHFVETYKGFSEAPTLLRKPIEIGEWLRRTVDVHNASPVGKVAPVALQVAVGLPDLDGDAALLTQVVLNLLKNAGEAVASVEQPSVILSASTGGLGHVRIVVADNGPGIPAHLTREVFLPFFTTKPQGSGIGLSLARQVVLLHGGQIEVGNASQNSIEVSLPAMQNLIRA